MGVTGVPPFPRARAGLARPAASAVEQWTTCAWLLAVEARAYLEDLEGGGEQPEMRQVVKLRLLELLADVDARLAGAQPPGEDHLLALALELGLVEVAALSGDALIGAAGLARGALDTSGDDGGVHELWDAILDAFPGAVPDPLVAEGQGEVLRALQAWSKLAAEAGTDAGYLRPFLEDA